MLSSFCNFCVRQLSSPHPTFRHKCIFIPEDFRHCSLQKVRLSAPLCSARVWRKHRCKRVLLLHNYVIQSLGKFCCDVMLSFVFELLFLYLYLQTYMISGQFFCSCHYWIKIMNSCFINLARLEDVTCPFSFSYTRRGKLALSWCTSQVHLTPAGFAHFHGSQKPERNILQA